MINRKIFCKSGTWWLPDFNKLLSCVAVQLAGVTGKRTLCDKVRLYIRGSLDFTLLRKKTFFIFCITGMLQKFVVNCYVPHAVNFALAAGVPRHLAVWSHSTLSCATIVCRIFVSLIADRKGVNRLIIYACGLFFEFLMCFPPVLISGIVGPYLSAILFGFQAGLCFRLSQLVLIWV